MGVLTGGLVPPPRCPPHGVSTRRRVSCCLQSRLWGHRSTWSSIPAPLAAEHPRAGMKSPSERARGLCFLDQGWCPPASSAHEGEVKGHPTHQSTGGHSTRSTCCGRNLSPLVSPCSSRDCESGRSFPGAEVAKERRKGCSRLAGRQRGPVVGGVGPPPNSCVNVLTPQRLRSCPPLETGWRRCNQLRRGPLG